MNCLDTQVATSIKTERTMNNKNLYLNFISKGIKHLQLTSCSAKGKARSFVTLFADVLESRVVEIFGDRLLSAVRKDMQVDKKTAFSV